MVANTNIRAHALLPACPTGRREVSMNGNSAILDLLPETQKRSLSMYLYYYKNGERGSYLNRGNHKVSASEDWHKYAKVMTDYPRTLVYDDERFHIVDMSCGVRRDSDKFLCIREVSPEYVYGVLTDPSHMHSYRYAWRDDSIFYDDEVDKFFHFKAFDAPVTSDKAFMSFWFESVEELITKHSWNEGHFDNSIRKLVRDFDHYKRREEFEKENNLGGDYNMCGRCYKRRCCCDNGSRELTYTVNPHSMSVEVSKGFRTLDFSMDEVAELASFFASAKTKIKEAKVAELEAQAAELAKQLEEAKSL
jgi:hypothetical protein